VKTCEHCGYWTGEKPPYTTSSSLQFEVHGRFTPNTEKNAALKANLVAVLPSSNQTFTVNTASFTTEQTAGAANGLALAINGSGSVTTAASPGELLTMTFAIKNTSATLIKDGVAQLIFQAPSIKRQSIINWAKLIDASNGDLRGEQISTAIRQASLTWNKKNLPQLGNLAPGEETSITLSVPVKNTETFDLSSIKERTIAITGGLTFTDASGTIQTLPLNRRLVSLGSDIAFEQRDVVTKDTNQAEVHTITWVASHSFGDLKKVKITAEVFPDVVFTQTVASTFSISNKPSEQRIFSGQNPASSPSTLDSVFPSSSPPQLALRKILIVFGCKASAEGCHNTTLNTRMNGYSIGSILAVSHASLGMGISKPRRMEPTALKAS
jgi:hypothetical protein